MKKSIRILEALNDIDEKFLIENIENIKNNSSKAFLFKNKKIRYVLTPAIAFTILAISIISTNRINMKNELKIANKNEISGSEENIIFNEDFLDTERDVFGDIDGKSVKMDVISNFEFLNKLSIPKDYSLINQFALYEKEDINYKEYTKLWQYSLLYEVIGSNINDVPADIEITFTKEDHILACMLPKKETFPISIIDGKEVYLFKSDKVINMKAFFEHDGYKFFVKSSKLTENEFIALIKSIIN